MTPGVRPLVAGNWKMNGLSASFEEVMRWPSGRSGQGGRGRTGCLPARDPDRLGRPALKESKVSLGGQDCSAKESGAFTGEIAAPMIKDAGASYVIVGHSERRQYHRERRSREGQGRGGAESRPDRDRLRRRDARRARGGQAIEVVNGQVSGSLPPPARRKRWSSPMSRSGRSAPA